jgi:hypothetical protein
MLLSKGVFSSAFLGGEQANAVEVCGMLKSLLRVSSVDVRTLTISFCIYMLADRRLVLVKLK